ncbi:FAD-dependent oxidoreductase [Priestia megaterium]|uniref:FAD-dependent oxidoreductase n=1 Tax=Priestia megaterium TaxID=1404 RepID=A0A6H1NZ32_PRIMG|nr:FAD-dependent oxidoreductase [Priestia megaterium]QIZ06447.1 FAD-dependent oxidoreductase [Priestia megaterium]
MQARYAVLATPAPITRKIAVDIEPRVGEVHDKIVYGPHVSAAFLTNEMRPQVWINVNVLPAPERSFDVLIHSSNLIRSFETERQPGSSFITSSTAQRSRQLIDKSDESYVNDINEIFPGFSDHVVESQVSRWPLGLAYVFPGRTKLQSTLTLLAGRLFLADDYLGTFYTDTAVQTGFNAAQNINSLLGSDPLEF